ncbi:Ctr copper transporter family-domain-containing protein [Mycena rosella]|uniref:Copper transport protein n=1 Tax=Mycena rosella TaxID=1033263 RepID=A0AAD7MCD3_MYCRO|nr:Ctr copper transporter family-domain-containing protein [Mycena rosella]
MSPSSTSTSMSLSLLCVGALLACAVPAHAAAANGMDMSMDDGMTLAAGTMMTTLHFTPISDTLWFAGWVPQSKGALAGACIGLFLLAIVERWVAAVRRMCEAQWAAAGRRAMKKSCDKDGEKKGVRARLSAPPFVAAHDVMRGAMQALGAALGYAFMLAVMTFQASFIISIVLGLGVGEMLFGRYGGNPTGAH